MDLIGLFVAALAGGLTASFLYERVSVWWRARTTEQWPKTLNLRGARVTIFADGMMIYLQPDNRAKGAAAPPTPEKSNELN